MRNNGNRQFQRSMGALPPFFIESDDESGRWLHPDVRQESKKLWPWVYRYVESVLRDAPRAAELLEDVAQEVSLRLQAEPEVGRNLKGYLITAFHHRIALELLKGGHITYQGLLRDLEGKHRLLARDWVTPLEIKICVAEIVALMPCEAQRVVHYRLLDYTWEEIAEAMGILVAQAKNKYYYGIKVASEKLFGDAVSSTQRRHQCNGTENN